MPLMFFTLSILSRGYREREIPRLILENNLYGLDIDKRAAQLATFALIMKAREYDRRLFSRHYSVNIHSIEERNTITDSQIDLFAKNNSEIKEEITTLVETFIDAKLYGSILKMPEINIELIREQLDYIRNEAEIDLLTTELIEYAFPLIEDMINQYLVLSKKYDVVVTNPPYMGSKGMHTDLKKYLKKEYPDEKSDLFAVMMNKMFSQIKDHGFVANVTMQSWMFLSSYKKLREKMLKLYSIVSMTHMDNMVMGIAFGTAATIFRNNIDGLIGKYQYIKLDDISNNIPINFPITKHRYNQIESNKFSKIPGSPIAYWASENIISKFSEENSFNKYAEAKSGLSTTDNKRFLRLWFELNYLKIGFNYSCTTDTKDGNYKFVPHSKGGPFKKWFGNLEYVVQWLENGKDIRKAAEGASGGRVVGSEYYFKEGLTWSDITSSGKLSVRYLPLGFIFDSSAPSAFTYNDEDLLVLMALMNSKVEYEYLRFLAPTFHFNPGPISRVPLVYPKESSIEVNSIVKENIRISKHDWDNFETSWDFEEHPFLTHKEDSSLIEDSFNKWNDVAEERFYQLKENEEELNRIFIDIYGLQDELTPEVAEKDVTVNKAKLDRDVKSFLSYLVGVMFGRYSLDKKGLAYAGGEWDESQYTSYKPDDTNIIPLTEDQYFEDDILNKIEELVSLIYGKETLEENLRFIAEALNMKSNESARDRIRRYFMKEFYKDHLKTYQKRPIYWQFTSGKRGAFKGLMYLHRYHKYTVAQLRTEYILHQATVLDNLITHEQQVIADETSSATQKARAQKTIDEYSKDRAELTTYDQVIEHIAKQQIDLDLDDGVKENYQLFQNIEVTDDTSNKPKKQNVFEKI